MTNVRLHFSYLCTAFLALAVVVVTANSTSHPSVPVADCAAAKSCCGQQAPASHKAGNSPVNCIQCCQCICALLVPKADAVPIPANTLVKWRAVAERGTERSDPPPLPPPRHA